MKTKKNHAHILGITLSGVLALIVTSAPAQIVTQPAGLTPGEQYQLVFVTDGLINAESSSILTYNGFALAQADTAPALVALDTTWTAIASTSSTSALSNTATSGTGNPIFSLDGSLVAATYTAFWSGTLNNPIDITESDATSGALVWTGTSAIGGSGDGPFQLGETPALDGQAFVTTAAWAQDNTAPDSRQFPIYAMSGVLTAAPEPGSAALLVLGAGALLGWRRRRM